MTATRLIFLAADGAPPREVTLGEGEARDVLVVPGAEATSRRLELPDGTEAQARAAAAFLLSEELIGEGAHIALGPTGADGKRLVVVVDGERLRGWLDEAARIGVDPAAVVPDYLLLPDGEETIAARFGPLLAVRGEGLAFSAEPDLAEAVLAGRPYRLVEGDELEAMLAAGPPIDLRQGTFARRGAALTRRDLRRAAVLVAALLVSPLVLILAGAVRDEVAARGLRERAEAVAAAAAPGAADPVAAVEGRMARLRAADAFPTLAADLFRAVEAVPGMRMDMLVYADDGALRTSVAYGSYSDMDRLREAARAAALELEEVSTLTEGERVTSELVVRRRR